MTAFNPKNPKPGRYPGVPNDVYHAAPGLSNSRMGDILTDMRLYQYNREHPKQADHFDVGGANHTLLLEPELFESQYMRGPDVTRRTNEWKDFVKEHPNHTVLKPDDYDAALRIRDAVWAHPEARRVLGVGEREVSYWWKDEITGVLCRCRPDHDHPAEILADVKTAAPSFMGENFSRQAYNLRYDRQAAFYLDGVSAVTGKRYDTWILILVCKEPPHIVEVYEMDTDMIADGRDSYREALDIYADYQKSPKAYIDARQGIKTLSLPAWRQRQIKWRDEHENTEETE